MKTTKTTAAAIAALLETMTPEQLETLAALATANAAEDKPAPKAPKPKKTAKAGKLDPEAWTSYRSADGAPHMGKAKNLPNDARDVKSHDNQGQALQRVNAMRKAEQPAPKPAKASKPAAKAEQPAPEAVAPQCEDLDALAARRDAKNAAIIATIPQAKRKAVQNKLAQLHKAGYRYARLERNKKHQLDGLHIYPGVKGHGRDAAFMACTTKQAQAWRAKADAARKAGKTAPKPIAGAFVWSPVGGGNLYARGIFGPITEA